MPKNLLETYRVITEASRLPDLRKPGIGKGSGQREVISKSGNKMNMSDRDADAQADTMISRLKSGAYDPLPTKADNVKKGIAGGTGMKSRTVDDSGVRRSISGTNDVQTRLAKQRKGTSAALDTTRDKELDKPGLVKSGVKKAFSGPHGRNNEKKVDAITRETGAKVAPMAAGAMLGGAAKPLMRMATDWGKDMYGLYNKFRSSRQQSQTQAQAQPRTDRPPVSQSQTQTARPQQQPARPQAGSGASGGTMTSAARIQAIRRSSAGTPSARTQGSNIVPKIRQSVPGRTGTPLSRNAGYKADAASVAMGADVPAKTQQAQAAPPEKAAAKDNPQVTQTVKKGPKEYAGSFKQAFAAARKDAGNSTGQFQWKDPKSGKVGTFQTNRQGEKYVAMKKQTPVAPAATTTTTTNVQGGQGIAAFNSSSNKNKPVSTTPSPQVMAKAAQSDKVGMSRTPAATPAAAKAPGTTKPTEKKVSGGGGGGGGGGGF